MPIYRHAIEFPTLDRSALVGWSAIPTAVASDCMNRAQTMSAAVKPLSTGTRLCAQARTVECMVGDNSAIHAALRIVARDQMLVISAGGYGDTAVWGGLLTRAAIAAGLAGLVVDGSVRDAAEIRELGFACFSIGVVPAGPHKGFGGTIDGIISCAGCTVSPGDIVLGDDDGIAVVPLQSQDRILAAAKDKIAQEEQSLERLGSGESLADQLGVPEPDVVQ